MILTRVDEVHKGSSGLIRREFIEPDLTSNQDANLERATFIWLNLLHEPTLVVHATIGSLHWSEGNWDRKITPLRESVKRSLTNLLIDLFRRLKRTHMSISNGMRNAIFDMKTKLIYHYLFWKPFDRNDSQGFSFGHHLFSSSWPTKTKDREFRKTIQKRVPSAGESCY